jgi:hypothetical protein
VVVLVVTELGIPVSVEQGPVPVTEIVFTRVTVTVVVTASRIARRSRLSRPATPLLAAMAMPKAAVAATKTRLKNILMDEFDGWGVWEFLVSGVGAAWMLRGDDC